MTSEENLKGMDTWLKIVISILLFPFGLIAWAF